jgi:glycerophosphoryl diester phosphodiesterase
MRPSGAAALCLSLLLVSCNPGEDVIVPQDPAYDLPSGLQPLTAATRASIEGIYTITNGTEVFGPYAALKWSYVAQGADTTFYLSMFCNREATYFILEGGRNDTAVVFSGYWRKLVTTDIGNALFQIDPRDGSDALLSLNPPVRADSVTIRGAFQPPEGGARRTITMRYLKPLFRSKPFAVIAHRAGGRNSDLLPASENSVSMALLAERFGANGIEIDVRLTSDGVPIIFHDENLNLRLNIKDGLVGPVESYTYAQLQAFVRLLHGEQIPTLTEMLDVVVDRTNLRVVWLDMKSERSSMPIIRPIQKAAMIRANAQALAGRRNPLSIAIGLPTSEKVDEFLQLPDYSQTPSICELSLDDVRRTNAIVWAPRWTMGLQPDGVAQMHAEERLVFMWTMDVQAFITQYISGGTLDGILTNYPSMVAFVHYATPR